MIEQFDIAAESAIIGSLLIDNSLFALIEGKVISSDFSHPHNVIIKSMYAFYHERKKFDWIIISDYIHSNKLLDARLGQLQYDLGLMVSEVSSNANVALYADIVLNKAIKRKEEESFDKFKKSANNQSLDELIVTRDHLAKRRDTTLSNLRDIEFDDFVNLTVNPLEYLIYPIIPIGGLCLLHAAPGVGKTHLTCNIGYTVSRGGTFLGWETKIPRGVLYIDGEMTKELLIPRLRAIKNATTTLNIQPAPFRLLNSQMQPDGLKIPDIASIEGQTMIEKRITPDIKLIILDNLSCLVQSGDENEAKSWVPINQWLISLRHRGIAVLVVHHQGKDGTQRGTSKKEDAMDTVIALEKIDDQNPELACAFKVKYVKHRTFYGRDALSFEARLYPNRGTQWLRSEIDQDKSEDKPMSAREKAVMLYRAGVGQEKIAEIVQKSSGTVSKYLEHLKK